MAVDEKEDFKGRRKRNVGNVFEEGKSPIWKPAFPLNVTVDELYLYRKKKNDFALLKDNLKIEEGSFKHLKTEYTRRFKNFYVLKSSLNGDEKELLSVQLIKPVTSLKLEGTQEHQSEYNETFSRKFPQSPNDTSREIMNEVLDDGFSKRSHPFGKTFIDETSETVRPRLLKRPTNLKIEGDFSHITEYADKFIEYLLARRAELCRTPTTLHIGTGEMESKTETTDQFRKFDNAERPSLIRKFTNLHLEGDLDTKTEKQEKYRQYAVQKRPPIEKQSTNLHLDGDYFLTPEYRHQYVQYDNVERAGLVLPTHNLKTAGLFETTANNVSTFGRSSPLIPFLRESYNYHDHEENKKSKKKLFSSRHQSNASLNRTSSHPNLLKLAVVDEKNSKRSFKPQTPVKNAYLDFDKNRNLSLDRRSMKEKSSDGKVSSMENIRSPIYLQPEYKSAFKEFPRGRPRLRRPESNFASAGEINYLNERGDQFIYIKEKTSETRQHSRRKSEHIFYDSIEQGLDSAQQFEGRFECQPEYRKAMIDYLIKEKPPVGQRRRILEIPDITVNSDHNDDVDNSNQNDNKEKNEPTSPKEERPKSSAQKPPSTSSSVLPSPKSTATTKGIKRPSSKDVSQGLRRSSKINTETVRLSPEKKNRVYQRSSTLSPEPQEKPGKSSSRKSLPNRASHSAKPDGNWNKPDLKQSSWNSTETDPAFFIVNERVPSRRSVRQNLYKEQRWMPSWYSDGL